MINFKLQLWDLLDNFDGDENEGLILYKTINMNVYYMQYF